ncbi:flagellar protein FlbD [Exiguobacterium sp. Leaf187]|uniref:Flagellar FlbD family protein n=1 Tax=Exiguobacterium indicum TaxID=296995 RepID=A0A0V8GK42_9BACL|nr:MULTISPECIES: flagellar FlbD family protein [Exiguobacterium]AHA30100.1 flagellar protein FlbD [Exiguobacterium sp. MH3]KOP29649.1 flagellar protein FlbD [Exiguobacterium sp. BMC-KP]KQS19343.1 flagellar protein FlbD [Exiguobacterium sp. Leaf187]KSU50645.1 flagellar protein FlbD [Exiguobacterium enclense]KTR26491.1 flagellar protein FlbD [Exiguobacterium indicum]
MIQLTTLRKTPLVINASLIESIRSTPDTTIHLIGGQTYVVQESMEEVTEAAIQFYRQIGLTGLTSVRRIDDGGRREKEK